MDSSSVSVNPCTDVARKMSKARETLENSQSRQERVSALSDFETLKTRSLKCSSSARLASIRTRAISTYGKDRA